METTIYEFTKLKVHIQLYHWSTKLYSRHVAAGEFYSQITPLVDAFAETMQKKQRVKFKNKKTIVLGHISDVQANKLLYEFKKFLKGLKYRSPALKNIRDEMLELTDRTIYLFSME